MRTAPACQPPPPPFAATTASTGSARFVNFSGSSASCFHAKFGKYCSAVRPFTENLPEPARKNTRAMDSLRRPVPRNQDFEPAMGVPVELNVPPRLDTTLGLLPTRLRKAPQCAEKNLSDRLTRET